MTKKLLALTLAVMIGGACLYSFGADRIQETSRVVMSVAGAVAEAMTVKGDTYNRFTKFADGKMQWGSGSATPDVELSRSSTGVIDVSTGSLALGGTTITSTAAELNRATDVSGRLVNLAAATLTLAEATHEGRIVTVNKADGSTITLPAATGSGDVYRIYVGTTITSNNLIVQVANASDSMVGFVTQFADAGTTGNFYEIAGTDDTITMDGSTKGGIKGDFIELTDIATNLWEVKVIESATGTEASPMSAAV